MKLNRVSLNVVGLNRIGLNRIGSPSRGSSSGSDRSYIDPEVLASLKAVVIVGNKTNNDSDRAIVKNLVDPDNPFVISNAAYKLNSGYGKYEVDFTDASKVNSVYNGGRVYWTTSPQGFHITRKNSTLNGFYESLSSRENGELPAHKIKVKGVNSAHYLEWRYATASTETVATIIIDKDGIYDLPKSESTTTNYYVGYYIIGDIGDCDITIEQISSFQGALVTDGINDLITSTKTVQEMLGGSTELTVVSMIHQISKSNTRTNFIQRINGSINNYAFFSSTNNRGFRNLWLYL